MTLETTWIPIGELAAAPAWRPARCASTRGQGLISGGRTRRPASVQYRGMCCGAWPSSARRSRWA